MDQFVQESVEGHAGMMGVHVQLPAAEVRDKICVHLHESILFIQAWRFGKKCAE
jgi:hypothetical protein